ncbi:hypothetical protein AC578_7508 [Pseudocercospora eumusae]|uniref:Uncharacterized protein n=1 Tax=Pseudocercospora eumusae TaxID=321146 RepID=A0A139GV98_9PEZI|nr:hypothetical protein AC578_7508 [Pseudocercospora eumusae]
MHAIVDTPTRQGHSLSTEHKQLHALPYHSNINFIAKMTQLDFERYQLYFDQKNKTLSDAITVGIYRAYEDSDKDQTCKDTLLNLLKFIIKSYEEDPKHISNTIANRATHAETQLEADIMMGISTTLTLYGSLGTDADADKVGLFLWVLKKIIADAEKDTMDGKEAVEAK